MVAHAGVPGRLRPFVSAALAWRCGTRGEEPRSWARRNPLDDGPELAHVLCELRAPPECLAPDEPDDRHGHREG